MQKKTIFNFHEMVAKGEKIVYLTAYDYLTAKMQEKAGVDMILVGDSLGMVSLGYDTTFPVTLEDMIRHCQAVRRGAPNTFIVGDMTYMSYQVSEEQAVESAGRLIKEGGVDAVKLEGGGTRIASHLKAINDSGILVMGHIGLTPQFAGQIGGYKAQGRSAQAALSLVLQAKLLEESGAFSILVEGYTFHCRKGYHRTGRHPNLWYWCRAGYPWTTAYLCRHGWVLRQFHSQVC